MAGTPEGTEVVVGPRPFRLRHDVPVLGGLALVVVSAAAGAGGVLPGPAVVLLASYAVLAALTWSQELLRAWAVGHDGIAVRRWLRWTALPVGDIRAVEVDPTDPFHDTLLFSGPGMRVVPVPLEHGRREPRFGRQVEALVERCRHGATVAPEVAAALGPRR